MNKLLPKIKITKSKSATELEENNQNSDNDDFDDLDVDKPQQLDDNDEINEQQQQEEKKDLKRKKNNNQNSLINNNNNSGIPFNNLSELKRIIQQERDILIILGYGVTYIHPTRKSLEALLEFSNHSKNEFKDKIKVLLIDEEVNRKFCTDNNLVVGTPILQMYYNGKNVRFRFGENLSSKQSLKSSPSYQNNNEDDDEEEDNNTKSSRSSKSLNNKTLKREDSGSKPRNVYIGQLHFDTINSLVYLTFEAIYELGELAESSSTLTEIIVDVDLGILRGESLPFNQEGNENYEHNESSLSDDTSSGEDTEEEDDIDFENDTPIETTKKQNVSSNVSNNNGVKAGERRSTGGVAKNNSSSSLSSNASRKSTSGLKANRKSFVGDEDDEISQATYVKN
ncbi:hypothetical protein ABK040_010691 [Willaertia magna]